MCDEIRVDGSWKSARRRYTFAQAHEHICKETVSQRDAGRRKQFKKITPRRLRLLLRPSLERRLVASFGMKVVAEDHRAAEREPG